MKRVRRLLLIGKATKVLNGRKFKTFRDVLIRLPVWLFWGQICKFLAFFNSFGLFYFWKKAKWNWAFLAIFGHLDFLCRFRRFKDNFGRFLGTSRFLDTLSGRRMINFHWKLCTRIDNFFCCFVLINLQFQVTLQQNQ